MLMDYIFEGRLFLSSENLFLLEGKVVAGPGFFFCSVLLQFLQIPMVFFEELLSCMVLNLYK